jgi:hypothetical protein
MRENFTRGGGGRFDAHAISLGFLQENGLALPVLKDFQETG